MIKIIISEYRAVLIPYTSIDYIDISNNTENNEIKELFIKFKNKIPILNERITIRLEGYDYIHISLIHKIQHSSFVEIYITKSNTTQNYYYIDIETIEKLNKEKEEKQNMLQTLKETLKNKNILE